MATLGVCGDSFMSAYINTTRDDCIDVEGKHFTEILAKKLNYNYFTLARSGCSNMAIRLQVDEIIANKPDLCIINTTSPNRLEIPHIGKQFDKNKGVYNLDYNPKLYPEVSAQNPKFCNNTISDTLTNIFHDDRPFIKKILQPIDNSKVLNNEQLLALEYYIDYLFDLEHKAILDSYIMQSAVLALEENKINYFIIWTLHDFLNNNNRIIDYHSNLNPNLKTSNTRRRFHTTDSAQVELADNWYKFLTENNYVKT